MEKHSKSFRDVIAWQKAHEFVLEVYRVTAAFPRSDVYSLTSQFRRAATSIPANGVARLLGSYAAALAASY